MLHSAKWSTKERRVCASETWRHVLRHCYREAIISITSERLTALVLHSLFHLPVWFALTALPVLQWLVNVSASSPGSEPRVSSPHPQGSSSKPLLLVLSLTCKIHSFYLDAKERIKQMCISINSISNAEKNTEVWLALHATNTLYKVNIYLCTLLKYKLTTLLSAKNQIWKHECFGYHYHLQNKLTFLYQIRERNHDYSLHTASFCSHQRLLTSMLWQRPALILTKKSKNKTRLYNTATHWSYLSSCWAAVESRVSSSSVFNASSSSPRSRFCFSALFLEALSDSRSSCSSVIWDSSSLIFFRAMFFWAASSSTLCLT